MQNDSVQVAVDVADSVEVRQLMQEVVKATAVYSRDGKPDLEKAQRGRAVELGISAEGIAAQWQQARQNWHGVWLRKLSFGAAKAEVKPKPETPRQENTAETNLGPQIDAAQKVFEKPQEKSERLKQLVGRINLKKPKPELEVEDEDEEEDEEEVEVKEEPAAEPGAAEIGKALIPVKRFASQIILPDLGHTGEIKDIIRLVNLKHQIVGNYGGRCMVVSWERWPVNPRFLVPTFQKVSDFKNRYANRFVEQETKSGIQRVPVGGFWFSHPANATFDSVAFRPGEDEVLPGKLLNLWRGWATEPKKGSWRLLRRHIYLVLGGGDWKAGRYILRWLAHMFQHPGEPGQTVLVFKGEEEGLGKGMMAQALMLILGPYSLPVSDAKHFLGAFSGHLQHCVFLFLDEAFWAGDQKAEGRLKSLVTERYITIEPKYVTPFQTPNLLHIMMASNNDWVVPAGPTARRYAVFEVSDKHRRDKAYFNALKAEIYNGGAAAMLYDLLKLDLGDWQPQELYETAALVEQKQWSLRGLDAWIESFLQKGTLPVPYSIKYPNRCLSEHLQADALKFDRYINESNLVAKLKKIFGKDNMKDFNNQVARGWIFPPLADCRQRWEQRYGGKWNWHHDIKEWRLP